MKENECEKITSALLKSVSELSNCRRDLQALVQDLALALQADILRPLNIAGQIDTLSDLLTNTEVLLSGLEEWVLLGISSLSGRDLTGRLVRSGSGLLSLGCRSLRLQPQRLAMIQISHLHSEIK